MKKSTRSTKLSLNLQTIRALHSEQLTAAAGGLGTGSVATRCVACDSFTVPVTRCM